ncbi:hypothetical protein BT96DRAFT_917432 [Gymnopus androsaceus JB14]|uniref:Uncharacterized protein n=1 Tax=Gymnopus androsaceus JB14 TaxID=1447944 RepID=A0A6A4I3F1_9AGAR|nr:hypothetical protein BT96DRAFT_917432 [Gymnopus androsaceus JB14]
MLNELVGGCYLLIHLIYHLFYFLSSLRTFIYTFLLSLIVLAVGQLAEIFSKAVEPIEPEPASTPGSKGAPAGKEVADVIANALGEVLCGLGVEDAKPGQKRRRRREI